MMIKLNHINKIMVQFSPYKNGSASARAFLAAVMCDKVKATNPKCDISTVLKNDDSPPVIDIVFADGQKHRMMTDTLKIREIVTEIGYQISRFPDVEDAA